MTEERCRSLTGLCAGACAFALVCAAAGAATGDGESTRGAAAARTAVVSRIPAAPIVPIGVVRDPFVADEMSATAAPKRAARWDSVVVRAVALGENARALIDDGGSERIVAAGDLVLGSRVAAIVPGGLVLTNGSRLPLVRR